MKNERDSKRYAKYNNWNDSFYFIYNYCNFAFYQIEQ